MPSDFGNYKVAVAQLNLAQRRHYFCLFFLERSDNESMPLSPLLDQYLDKIPHLIEADFIQCRRELESRHPCFLPQTQLHWIECLAHTVDRRLSQNPN